MRPTAVASCIVAAIVRMRPDGSLLVSDDMAGRIYRITCEGKSGASGLRTG